MFYQKQILANVTPLQKIMIQNDTFYHTYFFVFSDMKKIQLVSCNTTNKKGVA